MLPEFDALTLPVAQIPAAIAAFAAWQSQLAARLLAAPAPAPQANDGEDSMLTVEEVAAKLRCSTKSIYRRAKKLPFAHRNGSRSWLFSEQGLKKWLARQRV
jgi:excisionase family DNA binding protein